MIARLVLLGLCLAQSNELADDTDQPRAADAKAAAHLVRALRKHQRTEVAKLIRYPFPRPPPLPDFRSPEDFVPHFGDYFDERTIARILKDPTPGVIGWRGTQLAAGSVWFDGEGKVSTLNVWTEAGAQALKKAQQLDSAKLAAPAQGYDFLAVDCTTEKGKHIRVERFGEGYKYLAWKRGDALSSKPELVITHGTLDVEGTLRVKTYRFENKGFTYQVGADDGSLSITVGKGDGEPISTPCNGVFWFKADDGG